VRSRFLLFAYCLFLILFTIFSYLFLDRNLIYLSNFYIGITTTHRVLTSGLFLSSIIIFFFFYYIFLKQLKKRLIKFKTIILVTCLILFFSYPAMLSYDIFNYVATAKVVFTYHENPYVIKPEEIGADKNISFTRATNKIALYGPSWILATAVPNFLGGGNFILTLFLQKLLILFFYLATTNLIFKITKSSLYTALFALNPLVVIETLVSGHNDIFMIYFALLSLYLISNGKYIRSLVVIIVSIFVKYATLLLTPILIFLFLNKLKDGTINWNKVYLISAYLMFFAFLVSFFREIYPWYAIWFLPFVTIIPSRRSLTYISLSISFGLLLSYLPYLYSGNYFGYTPVLKNILIFAPLIFIAFKGRSWLKKFI